jgi:hypothetical protein
VFFSFLCKLSKDGEINFVYLSIPGNGHTHVDDIHGLDATEHGKVFVGISDAFGVGDAELRQYHRVTVDPASISKMTRVTLKPKMTCNLAKDCLSCVR